MVSVGRRRAGDVGPAGLDRIAGEWRHRDSPGPLDRAEVRQPERLSPAAIGPLASA